MGKLFGGKRSIDDMYKNDGDWEDLYLSRPEVRKDKGNQVIKRVVTHEKPIAGYMERISTRTENLVSD